MSSTAQAPRVLENVGVGHGENFTFTCGIDVLSSGTVELVTGLSQVYGVFATVVSGTDTQTAGFSILEDLPTSTGTVTFDGTKIDEGQAVGNGGSEQFSWFAWGIR